MGVWWGEAGESHHYKDEGPRAPAAEREGTDTVCDAAVFGVMSMTGREHSSEAAAPVVFHLTVSQHELEH